MLTLLVTLLPCLAAWLLFRLWNQRPAHDLHKVPGPKALPLLGNASSVFGNARLHGLLADWANQYGSIFRWSLGPAQLVTVTDPVEWARLLSPAMNLPKPARVYQAIEPYAPKAFSMLTDPDYESWHHARKTLSVAFSISNIKQMFPAIVEKAMQASKVLAQLSQQGPVEIDEVMRRITADVISTAAFDLDFNSLATDNAANGTVKFQRIPYMENLDARLEAFTKMLMSPLYALVGALMFWLPDNKRQKQVEAAIQQTERDVTMHVLSKGVQPEDNTQVWACLGRLKDTKTGAQLSELDLTAQVSSMFGAGFVTTAFAISWTLYELAAHPDIQARVQAELDSFGLLKTAQRPKPRDLEYADLAKLTFLNNVLKEATRLHPTAPTGSGRELKEDTVVCGYKLPAGTTLSFPPYALHHSKHNYIRPEEFWPDRWAAATDGKQPFDPEHPDATPAGNRRDLSSSWSLFSFGPRNCIGQTLALMEARAVLAILLARFKFELPEGSPSRQEYIANEEYFRITLVFAHGLRLKCVPLGSA
jgi:fatty acid synthase